MKIILCLIINLIIACNSRNVSSNKEGNSKVTTVEINKSDLIKPDSLNNRLLDTVTIIVSYAAIECGCPQWFETRFKDVEFLQGVERFYLEPERKDLMNANVLWDGEHLPLTLKVTGSFSKNKEIPRTYHTKGTSEKARIFWYDKITVLSPSSKH